MKSVFSCGRNRCDVASKSEVMGPRTPPIRRLLLLLSVWAALAARAQVTDVQHSEEGLDESSGGAHRTSGGRPTQNAVAALEGSPELPPLTQLKEQDDCAPEESDAQEAALRGRSRRAAAVAEKGFAYDLANGSETYNERLQASLCPTSAPCPTCPPPRPPQECPSPCPAPCPACPACPPPPSCPAPTACPPPPRRIPPGYEHYAGLGYYRLHLAPVTWFEAKATCEREGAHLAIINSQAEARLMANFFDDYHIPSEHYGIRIGFHDLLEEGRFYTVLGESLYSTGYSQWSPGEPSNGGSTIRNEDCGSFMESGLLNDIPCNWAGTFVCELP